MSLNKINLDIAYNIITSKVRELKHLAAISGRDIFTFYRGADLSSLDLSGQDLSGMNFEGANIRFSSFKSTLFDAGAFNGCKISDDQKWLTDEFNFYSKDVLGLSPDKILLFCMIRKGIIDDFIRLLDVSYTHFSEISGVSQNALRKARGGKIVAFDTAYKIFMMINEYMPMDNVITDSSVINKFKQPCVKYLYGGNNAPFSPISREHLDDMLNFRNFRIANKPKTSWFEYRDTIESLEWYKDQFQKTGYLY